LPVVLVSPDVYFRGFFCYLSAFIKPTMTVATLGCILLQRKPTIYFFWGGNFALYIYDCLCLMVDVMFADLFYFSFKSYKMWFSMSFLAIFESQSFKIYYLLSSFKNFSFKKMGSLPWFREL
jgi:hypothetical protein